MNPLSSTSAHTSSPSSKEPVHTPVGQEHKTQSVPSHDGQEKVTLSKSGQNISRYTEVMSHLPDTRLDRITKIRIAVENGTYQVSSQDLANKLIQDISKRSSEQ